MIVIWKWIISFFLACSVFISFVSNSQTYRLDPADFPTADVVRIGSDIIIDYVDGSSGTQATWDSVVGGARLTMPSNSGANGSGDFRYLYSFSSSATEITIAFRLRVSQSLIDGGGYPTNGGSYSEFPKIFISYLGPASCATNEYTMTNRMYRGGHAFYGRCGALQIQQDIGGGNFDLQPGGDTAWSYSDLPSIVGLYGLPVFTYEANEWATIVIQYDFSGPNIVETYARYDNAGVSNSTGMTGATWYKTTSFDVGANPDQLDSVLFTIYATNKSSSVTHTPWYAWYNDILVVTAKNSEVRSIYGIDGGNTVNLSVPQNLRFIIP